MHKQIRFACTCAVVAIAASTAMPAMAQNSPQGTVIDETEIVVTARKRLETAQTVPVPVTVLNEALLDRYSITGVAQIANLTPGLITGESSGSIGGSISLRGIGSGESQPFIDQVVSLNVDGVQISSAQLLRAAQLDLGQIEVLRGPQALFFGKNSPGGVISITSNNPTNELEVMARAGYEFRAHERYAEGMISGPLTNDGLSGRLAARYSKMDGYIRIKDVPSNLFPAGVDRYDAKSFPRQEEVFLRGTLQYEPSDRFTMRIRGTYTDSRISGSPSYFTDVTACPYGVPQESPVLNDCRNDGVIYTSLLPESYVENSWMSMNNRRGGRKNRQALLSGTIDYKLTDDLTLTSVTGYYWVGEHLMSNGSYKIVPDYAFAVRYNMSQASQELRLLSDFDGPLNFLIGGYYERRQMFTATQLGIPILDTNLYSLESTNQRQYSYSAYGQLMWDVTPALQITAGGRYTHDIKKLQDYTVYYPATGTTPAPVTPIDPPLDVTKLPTYPGHPNPKLKFNDFSPEVTVSWKPVDDVMLFASYKQGYKSGGFDGGYTAGAILNPARQAAGQTFRPEEVEGFEVGLKSNLLDRQLIFNLTGYWYDYRDLQVAVFDTQIHAFKTENAAKARVRGVEMQASFNPRSIPGFNLHATGAYNDAKFRNYLADCYAGQSQALGCNEVLNTVTGRYTSQDLSGVQMRKAPKFTGSFGGYYETAISNDAMFSISADALYSGGYISSTNYNPYSWQRKYATLAATARLFTPDKRWELALIGNNLTNKRNLINANDRNGTGGGKGGTVTCATLTQSGCDLLPDITGTPALPRTVALQVTFRH